MCECQGNPLNRVTIALGLPYLLVNRALEDWTGLDWTAVIKRGLGKRGLVNMWTCKTQTCKMWTCKT